MTSSQFLKTAEQLRLLSKYVSSAIIGKGKTEKNDVVNEYINNISKQVLQSYIEDSFLICYKENGHEYVDIWDNRDNAMYFIRSYGGYINLNWDSFRRKFKNIFDFSRYTPNENSSLLTFCDE